MSSLRFHGIDVSGDQAGVTGTGSLIPTTSDCGLLQTPDRSVRPRLSEHALNDEHKYLESFAPSVVYSSGGNDAQ
jgi:hypothetical protein